MNKFSQKLKSGIISHRDYLIVIGIVFVLVNIMIAVNGAWPYGSSTIVHSDTFAQIAPFFEHIFRTLKGQASLVYTNAFAGGVEILTTLIYMLICPFYLVIFLFGEQGIMNSFSLVLLLILIFNAIVFLWFSKKYFKNLGSLARILLALIFTFCGYISFNYGFFTWLVYPGITLLLVDAFLRLVNEKKIGRFIALMVWYVVESFGVGVSTNLILILLFFGFILFAKDKAERKGACIRLFVAYLVSILICVALLTPAIFAMTESSRNSTFFSNLMGMAEYNKIETKLAGLFIESGIAVFAVLYLIKCNKKEKINKFYFLALAVCYIPVVFDVCQKLLCGSIYFAFPFRFTFINTVLVFILACKYFEKLKVTEPKQDEFSEKTYPIFKFLIIFIISIFLISFILLEIFVGDIISENIKTPNIKGIVSLFYFFITVLFLAIVLFTLFGKWRKAMSQKFFKNILSSVLCLTLFFNFIVFARAGSTDTSRLNEASTLSSSQNIDGKLKYFQLDEDAELYNTYRYGAQIHDFFSSLISSETINSYESIGYSAGSTYSSSNSGTILADSLVGSKFYITSYKQERPYLKLIEKSERYYLYENLLATTGAVILPEGFEFDDSLNSLQNFENLAESFGVEGEMFLDVNVTRSETQYIKSVKYYVQKITFTAPEDGILHVASTIKYINDDEKFEDLKAVFGDDLAYYTLHSFDNVDATDLVYVEKGETVEFVLSSLECKNIDYAKFTFMNYQVASELCEKLKENQAEIKYNKNGYEVKVNLPAGGRLFVASPDINGMSYLFDGKDAVSVKTIGDFACFEIEAGTHSLVATYSYSHALSWLIVAIVCITMAVAIILIYKFVNLEKLGKPIFVFFCTVCVTILIVVYAFGFIMSTVVIFMWI